jgi:branched-chain amino acid transport system substrate-binding protein
MRRVLALLAAALPLVLVAGCGKDATRDNHIAGERLTIYVSVPLHGASSVNGEAVLHGAAMALARAHGRIGSLSVTMRALDDSTRHRGQWDPGQTTANAHTAINDPTTVGYLGEFNSGASAVSIPLLNRFDIAQVSPASTAIGLTSDAPGADPGEPDKYYPTQARTFARIVPSDAVEARAQVQLQRGMGCQKTFVLDDDEVDGADSATSFGVAAHDAKLTITNTVPYDPTAVDYSSLVHDVAHSGADCALISAIPESHAALLVRQLAAAIPGLQIFGTATLAGSSFTNPQLGGIPLSADDRVTITAPTLPAWAYPASGRAFLAAYKRRWGDPEPYAILGYEAMNLLLDAVSRSTAGGHRQAVRSDVVKALLDTRGRNGAIGTYSIKPDGDTTMRRYGVYRVRDGQLSFVRSIEG